MHALRLPESAIGRCAKNIIQEQTAKIRAHSVPRNLHLKLQNTGFGWNKRKDQRAIGLWSQQAIRRGNQGLRPEVLLSVSRSFLGSNEMGDNERSLSRNGNHRCLRNEPLHRCLFGLLENSYTSPNGIYYRYDKIVFAST